MAALQINIQATKRRQRWVKTMLYLLNEDEGNDRVNVCWDEKGDLWEGAKGALRNYQNFHSHVFIMQDDILPSREIIKVAERLIELLPEQIITLFSNRVELLYAKAEGNSWALLNRLLMAQAYIMPIPMVEDFLLFAEKHIKPEIFFDDNRITLWMLKNEIKAWATAPSLVEHVPGWNSTSLTGGYKQGYKFNPEQRMSRWFIGFENSGLSIDWTKGLDKPVTDKSEGDWSGVCQYYLP